MIEFKNLSFRYEESENFTLKNINMTVNNGEFILLTGRSGCGKTTLIRSLNGLIPHFYPGEIQGDLLIDGKSLLEMKPLDLAGVIGTVFQDPRSQFFMTDTTRELAFGCENMGMLREETIKRIVKATQDLQLESFLNRSIFALSSGEKQQVAIGSVYALAPKVYIFDEPSANLDYDATRRLADILKKLKSAGYTIFIAEHRFYYLQDLIDRVFWIENGQIMQSFTKEQFCNLDENTRVTYGLRTVYPERETKSRQKGLKEMSYEKNSLEVSNLDFFYKKGQVVLQNVNFRAESGDVIGILGHNGSGKTTLLSIMTGILKEKKGIIRYNGKTISPKQRRALSYLVMQDADYQLFGSSVEEELALGLETECAKKIDTTLQALELSEYKERHPASLSGGQKQRVTIGAAIVKGSPIIYFDEPTSGLDYDSMVRVSKLIETLAESGIIVFVVSHDFEFIVRTCTQILQLDEKEVVQNVSLTSDTLQKLSKQYFN
jgi:energy-coupling factor transport system ATP-binding protein